MIRSTSASLLLLSLSSVQLSAAEPWLLTPAELADLAKRAPAALTVPITTVVDGESLPGGDPHNYISYARYYWPNPQTPDGLPFVSRDGDHNREQVAKGDRPRINTFSSTVTHLAAAWHVHRDEPAARRAGEWLRAWYLAPATRMNPNLDFAQVRLGHKNNRGNPAGVLDTRDFASVIDAVRLLEDSPALSAEEHTALHAWFARYLDWLLTAPNAVAERAAKNNHATWYYAHAIPVARYAGRDDVARELCAEARDRIAEHIRPDGSQPEEIRRVDGLGYSKFNLEAYAAIARHARGLGFDLWNHTAPNGASLRKGLEFLHPYNSAPEKWTHKQKEKLEPGFLDDLLAEAARFSMPTAKP